MSHKSSQPSDADATPSVSIKFDSVLLVCGDCEQRGNGPTRLTAKQVRKDLKHQLTASPHKFRIVQSSCLGLCPKKAIAATAMPAGSRLLAAELKSDLDVTQWASQILKSS